MQKSIYTNSYGSSFDRNHLEGTYLRKVLSIASTKGGYCLSLHITDQKQKIQLQCANGHQWKTTAGSVIYSNSWCPVCAGNHVLSINEMKELAKSRGGICLSDSYSNSKTKLLWQCGEGHRWLATPFSVKIRQSWCPSCVKQNKNRKNTRS